MRKIVLKMNIMKMMTNIKTILLTLNAILIITIVISGITLQSASNKINKELSQVYMRKEEMLNQQDKLKQVIIEINNTLENIKNENLIAQISQPIKEPVLTTIVSTTTTTNTPTTNAPPQPPPRPMPMRRTRAS